MNKITYWKLRLEEIYYNIKYGLKNIYYWIPIIWEDRNYDYVYLYKILESKLRYMKQDLESAHDWVGKDIELKHIERVINRLEYLTNQRSYDRRTGREKHRKKWGETELRFEPIGDGSGNSTLHFDHKNANTPEEIEQERRESQRIMEREIMLEKQDLAYALKLIRKHSKKWWI